MRAPRRSWLSLSTATLLLFVSTTGARAEEKGGTLTLEKAQEIARTQHPSILRARADTGASEARARQTRAGLLPQVTGRLSAQHSSHAGTLTGLTDPTAGTTSATLSANQYLASATLSQLVWDFGRTTGSWESSRAAAAAQEATARATELGVLMDVSDAFFNAQAQRELLRVAQETVKNQQRHLTQVEAFIEVGNRPAIDRAQAATDFANARVQLIQAENAYALAKVTLGRAMGLDSPPTEEVASQKVGPLTGEDGELEPLASEALATRPELVSLSKQMESEKASRSAARGGYLPSIGVALTGTGSGREPNALRGGWTAAATLFWPLFDGLRTPAAVDESNYRLRSLEAAVTSEKQQIRFEVEQARLGVRAAKATLDASSDAESNARQRLRLAEGRYETGVGNILELSDAQLALTQASAQLIQAEFQLASERTKLGFLMGRGRLAQPD